MTFRQILILMIGLREGVAKEIVSRGTSDGIIQKLLEERGIYGESNKK